jgi:ABC-type lipoprotein export system ATPase subunit
MAIFRALHAAGRTLILVTHDPGLAAHCDRICRLEAGRLVSDERSASAPAQTVQFAREGA